MILQTYCFNVKCVAAVTAATAAGTSVISYQCANTIVYTASSGAMTEYCIISPDETLTWRQSLDACKSLGYSPLIVNDSDEMAFIYSNSFAFG